MFDSLYVIRNISFEGDQLLHDCISLTPESGMLSHGLLTAVSNFAFFILVQLSV